MLLDNARTMPPLFDQPAAREISCAQLGASKPPVAIVWGESTTPFFREISEAAAKCIPSGKHIVAPGAGHLWPGENSTGFTKASVGL